MSQPDHEAARAMPTGALPAGADDTPALSRRGRRLQRQDRQVGLHIRTRRLLLGLSQSQLAERLGMSRQQLDGYEHGTAAVPAGTMMHIAAELGRPAEWFAGATYAAPRADGAESLRARMESELPRGFLDFWTRRYSTLQHDIKQEVAARLPQAGAVVAKPAPPARPRVLLVDDAADVLVVLGAFLEGAGMEVVKASSGDQALLLVSGGERLDAIVSDYAMPGLSGVDLLQQARQLRPELPGMIVTGFADSARLDELPAVVEILRKPFRRDELIRRVRGLVASGRGLRVSMPIS